MKKTAYIVFLTAASLIIPGCRVVSRGHGAVATAPALVRGAEPAEETSASIADLSWAEIFRDPQLQELLQTALRQNYDLRLATEKISETRAQLGVSRSVRYPDLSLGASAATGKAAGEVKSTFFSLAPDASYQLDLFGKVKNQIASAQAQVNETVQLRNEAVLTLVSEVATDYFQLLTLDASLRIARDTVATQQHSLQLVALRVKHGTATRVELLQAQQVLDQAKTQIPDLERQVAQMENALSFLVGKMPDSVHREQLLDEQYLPARATAGAPSALLQRRPDIRAAEQQLIAANANIDVARAAFYPNITLSLSGGGAMGHQTGTGGLQQSLWNMGAQLNLPIFNAGRLRGNLHVTESQQRQALLNYQKTIQKSFQEASDAAIGYQKLHAVRVEQENNVRHLNEAAEMSLQRYKAGIVSYAEVLDAQRSLFAGRLSQIQARGNEQMALVSFYKSLGGGWK